MNRRIMKYTLANGFYKKRGKKTIKNDASMLAINSSNNILYSKKAIIEVGFAWIFIMIAGIVILGLFIYIGFNQGSFFKNLLNQQLLSDLNTIFASAMVGRNTAALFEVPESTFKFTCNAYTIGKSSFPITGMYVFAPPTMTTSELVTWSQGWNIGFRVTNFLYITSPQVKYYVAYFSSEPEAKRLADKMIADLPDQLSITQEMIDSSLTLPIKNENFDRIHILIISSSNTKSINIVPEPGIDKQKINVIYASNVKNYDFADDSAYIGNIYFIPYVMNSQSSLINPSPAFGIATIYGALYSGDKDTYDCIITKAFSRAKLMALLYSERANNFKNNIPSCALQYNLAQGAINSLHSGINPSSININALQPLALQVAVLNANLEQSSCSLLY